MAAFNGSRYCLSFALRHVKAHTPHIPHICYPMGSKVARSCCSQRYFYLKYCFNLLFKSTSWSFVLHQWIILHYLFSSLYCWALVQWPFFFFFFHSMFHSMHYKHIIQWLTEVMRDCYCWTHGGYYWTSGLFLLSFSRRGRFMLGIWAWGKSICNLCCWSLISFIILQ